MAGYKGKKVGKTIAVVGTTAALALTFVGVTVFNEEFARPDAERIEPSYGATDTNGDTILDRNEHTVVEGPDIITEEETPGYTYEEPTEDYARPTRPEGDFEYIPEHGAGNEYETFFTDGTEEVITEVTTEKVFEEESEATTEDVIEILATLTSWFQEHLKESYNLSQNPNLTVISLDSASIDYDYGMIQLTGSLKTDNNLRTFTADIANDNTDLSIFNLSNISVSDLSNAFVELKNSDGTKTALKLGQFIKIENKPAVVSSILTSRYNDVSKINSKNTKAEAEYLKKLLQNPSSCTVKVSVTKLQTEDGWKYTCSAKVNTGKYTYYTTHYITSTNKLKDIEIQEYVNKYLSSGLDSTIHVTPNSVVNQTIHEVNQQVDEFDSENKLSK